MQGILIGAISQRAVAKGVIGEHLGYFSNWQGFEVGNIGRDNIIRTNRFERGIWARRNAHAISIESGQLKTY